MDNYFLKLPHIKNAKGQPTFMFVRDNKRIIALSNDIESCRIYANDLPINDEYLVPVELTVSQIEKLRLRMSNFKKEA